MARSSAGLGKGQRFSFCSTFCVAMDGWCSEEFSRATYGSMDVFFVDYHHNRSESLWTLGSCSTALTST